MKNSSITVLMAAAECRGIAKVGGLADVVFDLSANLVKAGHSVCVIVPSYGNLPRPADIVLDFLVRFGGASHPARLKKTTVAGLEVHLLEASFFQGEWGDVYIDSGARGKGPFEDDAQRFAFFSAAVWTLIKIYKPFKKIQILHCHDWHTAWIPLLVRLEGAQGTYKTVFTIHNLDYQGTRPFDEAYAAGASFRQWFPELWGEFEASPLRSLTADPQAPHCFNPMRTGIRLADGVNTVSPTYAVEITQPDNPASNFFGGRGLDPDLQLRQNEGRLKGILNGMDYESNDPGALVPAYGQDSPDLLDLRELHKRQFLGALPETLTQLEQKLGPRFANSSRARGHLEAFLKSAATKALVVCVTRAVRQKLSLMIDSLTPQKIVLDAFLDLDLCLLVIGSGELEAQLEPLNDHPRALFLNAFDPALAQKMYSVGDLFLMPSDFEPCGLSQLQSLRYGCLPIVHDRGGLHDTVLPRKTGFVFHGETRDLAIQDFLEESEFAVKLLKDKKKREAMTRKAMTQRFTWEQGTREYAALYTQLVQSE